MFYRGQFCELDFQNLDDKQCRPPKKFPIRFMPLIITSAQIYKAITTQWLTDFAVFDDVFKEFSTADMFHNHEDVRWSADHLIPA